QIPRSTIDRAAMPGCGATCMPGRLPLPEPNRRGTPEHSGRSAETVSARCVCEAGRSAWSKATRAENRSHRRPRRPLHPLLGFLGLVLNGLAASLDVPAGALDGVAA